MQKYLVLCSTLILCLHLGGTPLKAAEKKMVPSGPAISGAGSTFINPLMQRWITEYRKIQPEVTVSYDAVGSGEGTNRFLTGSVDFGASDAALSDEQMAGVKNGVQLIPATAGIIVLAYNLPDIKGELRLSRAVYTDIFLGKIRSWDDPRIQALNPQLKLPSLAILTVIRADSSGTTWAFTNHLSAISPEWSSRGPGTGKKIDWPGSSVASRFNEGVATRIKHSWGSIGYVEYGVAKRAKLAVASLENRAGKFIQPDDNSGSITLANTAKQLPENLRLFLPDPQGANSYPIITYSWLLLYGKYPEQATAKRVKDFLLWGLTEGQKHAAEYGYAPLPAEVVAAGKKGLGKVQ